ncbi:MAG TPA: nodulation protein NfeD [Candidatus Eisenbacteria bacterium]|jgi:membrane-bound serine protease (ClpP class)|nr:nodulation protein NfeD [Candidatus Eisenbacteria bacterium]
MKLTLNSRPAIRAFVFAIVAILTLALFLPTASISDEQPTRPLVMGLNLNGEVEPVLATYIDEGLAEAARRNAVLVLISMDTPGGLSDSMKDIIQHVLSSPVPVAVYVGPTGSRGASAGFFILMSADVAAMAPGTRTGAASPVIAIGGFTIGVDEVLRRKIMNDAMAFLRSYSEKRGRNAKLAETAVTDARAFTEKEALDGNLIEFVSTSPEELLRNLDGRTVTRFDGSKTTLKLTNYQRAVFELSARQKFLSRIVEPDMFFLLLILGTLGLYAEFTHPGAVIPGVVGAICSVLALYAMHLLPVNIAGVLLILTAVTLFVLEAKFTSHGVLLLGGVVAMVFGAIFLIRSPLTSGGVSLGMAIAVTLPFAGISVFLMRLVLRSRKWKPAAGVEELLSEQGIAVMGLQGGIEGMIRIHGESWRATSTQDVAPGSSVKVLRIEGLKLHVAPVAPEGRAGSS